MAGLYFELTSRYEIQGKLEPAEALHVGCGAGAAETDAAFLQDGFGPLIPGSSLRGVLRSRLERIIQTLRPERGCVLFVEGSHPECATAHGDKQKRLGKLSEKERVEKIAEGALCDICRLFGSTLLASPLRIADARPTAGPHLQIRHGVGIDRDTGTAREKIKYDFEALERGPAFGFHLELENASDEDFALLAILLGELTGPGVPVGGKKSRGFGLCKLNPEYEVRYFDQGGVFRLADYLSKGSLEPFALADFKTKLSQALRGYLAEGEAHAAATA